MVIQNSEQKLNHKPKDGLVSKNIDKQKYVNVDCRQIKPAKIISVGDYQFGDL